MFQRLLSCNLILNLLDRAMSGWDAVGCNSGVLGCWLWVTKVVPPPRYQNKGVFSVLSGVNYDL